MNQAPGLAEDGPFVVDASVVVKWYVPEPDSLLARDVLASDRPLLAPDLLIAEVGNILWKKVRRDGLPREQAGAVAERLLRQTGITLVSSTVLMLRALDVANTYGVTMYESLYLALAVQDNIAVVTADEWLVNALAGTPLSRHVRLLSTF